MPLHTPSTNISQLFAIMVHSLIQITCQMVIQKDGDQIKHNPPETTRLITPKMNINVNDPSQLKVNLNICISARDNSLLQMIVIHNDTSFPKMLSHQTLTTCISMQQQNIDNGCSFVATVSNHHGCTL